MRTEISAGAVIVRKKKFWEVLCIRDMNANLTFPKGLMEQGETKEKTAEREALEETGITKILPIHTLTPVTYWYIRDGEKIKKTVYYILFSYDGDEPLAPQQEEGISEIVWLPIEQAIKHIGYPKTNMPLLKEAIAFLSAKSAL